MRGRELLAWVPSAWHSRPGLVAVILVRSLGHRPATIVGQMLPITGRATQPRSIINSFNTIYEDGAVFGTTPTAGRAYSTSRTTKSPAVIISLRML